MVHHRADRLDRQPGAQRRAHVDQEDRQAIGFLRHRLARLGAGQQQHQVRMFGPAGPDLLSAHHVVLAMAGGGGGQAECIGAAAGFGDAKGLQPQLARGQPGQVLSLLRGRAVAQQGVHDVHLGVGAGPVAAGGLNLLHDHRRFGKRQARAAIFSRDQRGEEARFGQRGNEFVRIGAAAVLLAPVFARKTGAQLAYRLADFGKVFAGGHRAQAFSNRAAMP